MDNFIDSALYHLSALEQVDLTGLDCRSKKSWEYSMRCIRRALEDAKKKEPQPGVANLDAFTEVTFNYPPYGGWIGEAEMARWLITNRDKDYWDYKTTGNADKPTPKPIGQLFYVDKKLHTSRINPDFVTSDESIVQIYAEPQQRKWQGLTDEEWYDIWQDARTDMNYQAGREDAQQMIEAKLKEKNT